MTDEFDRFQAAWGNRTMDASIAPREVLAGIVDDMARLDRKQLRSDVREVAVAAGASGVLAATLMWITLPWLKVWVIVLSVTAALIAVWRYIALFRRRSGTSGDSLAAFCRAELSRLDSEIRLQRSLAWWYLAPILIGTNVYVWASAKEPMSLMMMFFPFSVAIILAIAWATRRSLQRELLPRRDELAHCLAELEVDGDT